MARPFAPDRQHRPVVLAGTSPGPESDAVAQAAFRLARSGRGRLFLAALAAFPAEHTADSNGSLRGEV